MQNRLFGEISPNSIVKLKVKDGERFGLKPDLDLVLYKDYSSAYMAFHKKSVQPEGSTFIALNVPEEEIKAEDPTRISSNKLGPIETHSFAFYDKDGILRKSSSSGNDQAPISYSKLLENFQHGPSANSNKILIAALFSDYANKGSGLKQFVYFHTKRTHTQTARDIFNDLIYTDAQKKIETHDLTNNEILDKLVANYNKITKPINPNGSFKKRIDFAVLQLTHGMCETIEAYKEHKPLENAKPKKTKGLKR